MQTSPAGRLRPKSSGFTLAMLTTSQWRMNYFAVNEWISTVETRQIMAVVWLELDEMSES
jgi:hypothetical protein